MEVGRFLAGVAAVIYSARTQRYLLLRRADEKDFAAGTWECLTGRVNQGEGFEDALRREIREELDISADIVYILGTTHFQRGAPSAENELVGVVYLCLLDEKELIKISAEHSQFRWLDYQHAIELLSAPDPSTQWARRVIERAQVIIPMLPEQLADYQQSWHFEFG